MKSVDISLSPLGGFVIPSHLWVGDTATVNAVAGTRPEMFCYRVLYTSKSRPEEFSFALTDSSVASLSQNGFLSVRQAGATTLTATSRKVSSIAIPIIIGPPIRELRIRTPKQSGRVGDTITITVDALDSAARPIDGAHVDGIHFLSPQDSVARIVFHDPILPRPYSTYATPYQVGILLQRTGTVTIIATAPHAYPARYLSDTTAIAITP